MERIQHSFWKLYYTATFYGSITAGLQSKIRSEFKTDYAIDLDKNWVVKEVASDALIHYAYYSNYNPSLKNRYIEFINARKKDSLDKRAQAVIQRLTTTPQTQEPLTTFIKTGGIKAIRAIQAATQNRSIIKLSLDIFKFQCLTTLTRFQWLRNAPSLWTYAKTTVKYKETTPFQTESSLLPEEVD